MRFNFDNGGEVSTRRPPQIDGAAESGDVVEINLQDGIVAGTVLYVNVNGVTVLRIGGAYARQIEIKDERRSRPL